MNHLPLIFADLDDLIRIGLIVLFLAGPALGKLLQQGKAAPPRRRKAPGDRPGGGANPPPAAGVPKPAAGQPVPAGRDALEAEIEEFLKRATRKPPDRDQPPKREPKREKDRPVRPALEQPVKQQTPRPARPRRATRRRKLGEGIAEHVQEHIESHPVSEHSRELGQQLSQTDERVEEHLHEVFDHQLGSLEKSTTGPQPMPVRQGTDDATWATTTEKRQRQTNRMQQRAARVIEMLGNPNSVRDAVIVSEILKPPVGMDD